MSNYLLNVAIRSSDPREFGKGAVYEVAECVYQLPLPWLACFRIADLVPGAVALGEGEFAEVVLPCVDVATAARQLAEARPWFDRLGEGGAVALEYHALAVQAIEALSLPYLTLDVGGLLSISQPEEVTEALARVLAWDEDSMDCLLGEFLAYTPGVEPYTLAAFVANQGIDDAARIDNTIALDIAIAAEPFERV